MWNFELFGKWELIDKLISMQELELVDKKLAGMWELTDMQVQFDRVQGMCQLVQGLQNKCLREHKLHWLQELWNRADKDLLELQL